MRLTKIKLAGFKSFVDPTVLDLPSNLVAVVGPNGCGKSNIIDAVRWVMGESSAHSLRGESMADVIFNGSSVRKPVGQAAIELVFDNSQGRLAGPWAQYAEISIRRLVTRDGQSSYFINGTRCRRRDITDIFLGTGLGPRSYAIIEQGMISRIIESRPEELRVFFEEAAGISKYKERRRETENRIQHTRENLDRLNDLREELGRQLQHLQRQAQAAEQYQRFKQEERRFRSELLAMCWRTLDAELGGQRQALGRQETALAAVIAEQRRLEAQTATTREQQVNCAEALNRAQEHYYAVGAEISRLEQLLEHQAALRRRQAEELEQLAHDRHQVERQTEQDSRRLSELEQALSAAEPALALAQTAESTAEAGLAAAEAAMHDWQTAWEAFSRRAAAPQQQAEVERTRIEQLERQLLQQERRLERLRLEQDNLADTGVEAELEELQLGEQAARAELAAAQGQLQAVDAELKRRREQQQQLTAASHRLREQVQQRRGRLSSLQTLQEAALGRRGGAVEDWLRRRALAEAPRLAERLQVEPGWEQAVETVLGERLQAVCVAKLDGPARTLAELAEGGLLLFEPPAAGAESADGLLGKIRAPWSLTGLVHGVDVAAGLDEALQRRAELQPGESLVSPDGVWLGRNWLCCRRGGDEQSGVLAREQEIQLMTTALDADGVTLHEHAAALEQLHGQVHGLEQERTGLQEAVNQGHRDHARLQGRANALSARLEQTLERRDAVREEREELAWQTGQDQEQVQAARLRLEEALHDMERLTGERQTLQDRREHLRTALDEHRRQAAAGRQDAQRQALACAARRANLSSTRQALDRLAQQQKQLQDRDGQLRRELAAGDEPVQLAHAELEERLRERLAAEAALAAARQAVEVQDTALRELDQARLRCERQAQALRQALENQRLSLGEGGVRQQTLVEQLLEIGAEPAVVLETLPAEAAEGPWQAQLDKLAARIQRLGAINLAAIDEFAELSERKQYLDAQNADLVEALTTLENAIHKIDRETRSRFKDTFEQVNAGLQALFPRLFGGGQAYLELTGEDVLDAGVAIMARPPGKRVGTIHLLSGGEKALTAVALVFAIFELNPAPFCMLDEVDAPLDEANVGRFGNLVREMSERVQFIFITHNKATMEIARQLAGVTMQEPGVSRLVAVDVDEAVRLAAIN